MILKKCYTKVGIYEITTKRITVMMDDDLDKKIRLCQAKIIQNTHSSKSYSRVVNELLEKHLK